jgi:hypothetical protein
MALPLRDSDLRRNNGVVVIGLRFAHGRVFLNILPVVIDKDLVRFKFVFIRHFF